MGRSDRMRLTPALPISRGSRVFRSRRLPGRTSSLPRRKLSASSWRENTAAGSPLLILLSRRGLTTRWRQQTCCDAWSRSTWWTGSLATGLLLSLSRPGVRLCLLPSDGERHLVPLSPVALNVYEALDVHRGEPSQVTLN